MTFEHALFVTFSHDHTAQALRRVVRLMRRHDGRTSVLAVLPPAPALQRLLTPKETSEEVERAERARTLRDLEDWVAKAAGSRHPDDVVARVATGHVVATVLEHVIDDDHDLLAVTSHPDDPATRAIVKRLQRKSPCPVWAIRPNRDRRRRVLAAIDTDPDHHGLDHRILSAASWIIEPDDELHVVTAWELVGEATLRSSPYVAEDDATLDELRARCETEHRATLQGLLAEQRFPTDDVRVHVVNGPAADAIVELVGRHRINQLVMGTIGRTGLPGFVVGNTAEQLLSEVTCSILVVKPPGFVSAFHA